MRDIGGEEFLITLPGCDLQGASNRAEELRAVVSRKPIVLGNDVRPVTISLGMTATIFHRHKTIEALLSESDEALYHAKRKGKNRAEAAKGGA